MIELKNITKHYGDSVALQDVTLSLPDTGFFLLKGKNGAGKSTLLNLLAGVDSDFKGSFYFGDTEINKKTLPHYHESDVREIYQTPFLLNELTVKENLLFPFEHKDEERAKEILSSVGLNELQEEKVADLSAGERERLAIAIALYEPTPILLADEITANLDEKTADEIVALLSKEAEHALVILATHDEEDYEADGTIFIDPKHRVSLTLSKTREGKAIISPLRTTKPWNFMHKVIKRNRTILYTFWAILSVFMIGAIGSASFAFGIRNQNTIAADALEANCAVISLEKDEVKQFGLENKPYAMSAELTTSLESEETLHTFENSCDYLFLYQKEPDYPLLAGTYPTNDNEIVISSFLADSYVKSHPDANYAAILRLSAGAWKNGDSIRISGIYQSTVPHNAYQIEDLKTAKVQITAFYGTVAPFAKSTAPAFARGGPYYETSLLTKDQLAKASSVSAGIIEKADASFLTDLAIQQSVARIVFVVCAILCVFVIILFFNALYLREKDNTAYARLLGVNRNAIFMGHFLLSLIGPIFGCILGFAFSPLFNWAFGLRPNADIIGITLNLVSFSPYALLAVALPLLCCPVFYLLRSHKLFRKDLTSLLRQAMKNQDD